MLYPIMVTNLGIQNKYIQCIKHLKGRKIILVFLVIISLDLHL